MTVRVTTTDLETDDSESVELKNDYVITVAGSCHVSHIQAYANGTHVITVKRPDQPGLRVQR